MKTTQRGLRYSFWISIAIGLCLTLFVSSSLARQQDQNLVPNPSFEEGTDSPNGWYTNAPDSHQWAAGIAHTGNRSVRVHFTSTSSQHAAVPGWISDPIAVIPGRWYELSYWYRATPASPSAYIEPEVVSVDGSWSYGITAPSFGDDIWYQVDRADVPIPTDVSEVVIVLLGPEDAFGDPTTGDVYYDDIEFVDSGNWFVSPTPSSTSPPVITPTMTPIVTPPSGNFSCGEIVAATACGGGSFRFVLNPCQGGDLDSVALFETSTIPGDSGDLVRLINPTFDTGRWCSQEFGNIAQTIIGYEQAESLSSCSECGLSPVVTPTPLTGLVDLDIVSGTVRTNPEVPAASQAFSVEFKVANKSLNTSYDHGNGHYKVNVSIRPPLEDGWTLPFSSRDAISVQHLDLKKLPSIPPQQSVKIEVSGLSFPLGFNNGDVVVEFIPESKDTNPANNIRTHPLSVSGPQIGFEQCTYAFLKFYIGKLLKIGESLHKLGKISARTLAVVVSKSLDLARDIEIRCQSREGFDYGPGCVAEQLGEITEQIPLTPAELGDLWAGVIVELLNPYPIKEVARCLLWVFQLMEESFNKSNTSTSAINFVGVSSASVIPVDTPVYALVSNSLGQRVGLLDNGTVVQEFGEARVVTQDVLKTLFYTGNDTATIRVRGVSEGAFNLIFTLAVNDTVVSTEYLGVPTTASMVGTIDTSDKRYVLAIDEDGDGTVDLTREPDKLSVRDVVQPTGVSLTCEESGGTCFDVVGSEATCPNGGAYIGWCAYDPEKGIFKKCCGAAPVSSADTVVIPQRLPATGESKPNVYISIAGVLIALGLLSLLLFGFSKRRRIM